MNPPSRQFLPADPARGHLKSPSILHSFKRNSHLAEPTPMQRAVSLGCRTAMHVALMPAGAAAVADVDLASTLGQVQQQQLYGRVPAACLVD